MNLPPDPKIKLPATAELLKQHHHRQRMKLAFAVIFAVALVGVGAALLVSILRNLP